MRLFRQRSPGAGASAARQGPGLRSRNRCHCPPAPARNAAARGPGGFRCPGRTMRQGLLVTRTAEPALRDQVRVLHHGQRRHFLGRQAAAPRVRQLELVRPPWPALARGVGFSLKETSSQYSTPGLDPRANGDRQGPTLARSNIQIGQRSALGLRPLGHDPPETGHFIFEMMKSCSFLMLTVRRARSRVSWRYCRRA